MKEFRGTRGKWIVSNESLFVQDENGLNVAFCIAAGDSRYSLKIEQANIRLIAAAPELLDALQKLVESLVNIQESDLHNNTIQYYLELDIEEAEQAINKALGL